MANLNLKHVYKVYSDGTVAVSNFDLEIENGEFVILVGPSGCGKSTTLRMIAGLEDITAGDFMIDNRRVNASDPKDRNMAMVFQNYALYPHMNVYENMAFGLRINHVDKTEIDNRVRNAAETLGLTTQLSKKPKDMSGGQKQRVALGRAIVRKPSVFLLDEPLSNLDAKLRASMRSEIRRLHNALKTTFIYVTHDQVEAMTMGTKIVVMSKGFVQQVDSPMNLYDYPSNLFVAGFIGTPQMNIFNCDCSVEGEELLFKTDANFLYAPKALFPNLDLLAVKQHPTIKFGIRPENLSLVSNDEQGKDVIKVDVSLVEALGNETICEGTIQNSSINISAKISRNDAIREGDVATFRIDFNKVHLFSQETTNTLLPRLPSNNFLSFKNEKSLFGTSNQFSANILRDIDSCQHAFLNIPTHAITEGNTFKAKIIKQEKIKNDYVLTLQSADSQNFFALSKEEIKGSTFHFDLKYHYLSLYNDAELIYEAIPEMNHIVGNLKPLKKNVVRNGKTKKMKVFNYHFGNYDFLPDDERINKIYALLGKKFHLHSIDFSFKPEDIHLSTDGISGTVDSIIEYGPDNTFAKIMVSETPIYIKVVEPVLPNQEVHLTLDPNCVKVRDINFNVIIL